jgi:peptidoglycan/LPS O-acetylase OafA/YrhL
MLWPQLDDGSLRPLNAPQFYLRRALRIFPPYVVAVVVAVGVSALMWKFGGPSWWPGQAMQSVFPASAGHLVGNLATHLTFTHGFFPDYDRSIDGAFWSLSTELQFYLVLPFLIFVGRRWGIRPMLTLTALIPVGYVVAIHLVGRGFITAAVGGDLILLRLVEFGAGMLAAWLISQNRRVPFIRVLVPAGLLVGIVIDHYAPLSLLSCFGWAFGFGALVFGCCVVPGLRRIAEWNPLRSLGKVSYSAYLIHGTVYMLVAVPLTRLHASMPVRAVVFLVVAIPLALLAATVLNRLVERRAVGWSHRVRGVRRSAEQPLVSTP